MSLIAFSALAGLACNIVQTGTPLPPADIAATFIPASPETTEIATADAAGVSAPTDAPLTTPTDVPTLPSSSGGSTPIPANITVIDSPGEPPVSACSVAVANASKPVDVRRGPGADKEAFAVLMDFAKYRAYNAGGWYMIDVPDPMITDLTGWVAADQVRLVGKCEGVSGFSG